MEGNLLELGNSTNGLEGLLKLLCVLLGKVLLQDLG